MKLISIESKLKITCPDFEAEEENSRGSVTPTRLVLSETERHPKSKQPRSMAALIIILKLFVSKLAKKIKRERKICGENLIREREDERGEERYFLVTIFFFF